MNQTWENAKKPNFGLNFGPFGPNLGPLKFSWVLPLLDVSYHCMQFQGKRTIQTEENGKKTHFGPDLGPLGPNSGCQNFFSVMCLCQSLDIMVSYHHVKYQRNLMVQSWENLVTDGRIDRWTDRQTRVIS